VIVNSQKTTVTIDWFKLLAMYEKGALTALGLISCLIDAATERPSEDLVQAIPSEILLKLKMHVMNADLENGFLIFGGTVDGSVDRNDFLN
jgi:hypothetical protein